MQSVSSRIWTRVAVFISYDDNNYTTGTSVEDIRRQCIHHFAWTFVNEKAVFKEGAAFVHSRSKPTTRRRFRAFFAIVSMQQKRGFCVNMWQRMKHGSTISLWSQIGSQLSGNQQVEAVQSDQRRKHLQSGFWPLYFCAMHFVHRLPWRKEEPSIASII